MSTAPRLTLTIDGLTSEGVGIARLGKDIYFVPGAWPGETVEALLDGRRRKVWQTRLLKLQNHSPDRRSPPCPHYQRCGGCDLQHVQESSQLSFKVDRVQRELTRQQVSVAHWAQPIVGAPWHYRRKARIGVRFSKEHNDNIIGFREASSSHLTNIDRCLVLPDHPALDFVAWRALLATLAGRALITQIEILLADNALGLVLRVLKPLSEQDRRKLIEFLADKPGLAVQLWLKEDKTAAPELIWPQPSPELYHQVDDLKLRIGIEDFLQVNQQVNVQMVAQAMAWLAPKTDEVIWDLFAGHGNFSVPLAKRGARVLALEGSPEMVNGLRTQSERLGIELDAQCVDLTQSDSLNRLQSPAAILLDPPRAGAAEIVPALLQSGAQRILYVSCDAATLARDLNLLAAGYEVVQAGVMDMFPQTHHVETMVLLQKKAKRHGKGA